MADVILGLPVTGRTGRASKRIPGTAANVMPLRLALRPDMALAELAAQVSGEIRQVLRHQRYRYEDLLRDLNLAGANHRLFGTLVNVEQFNYDLRFAGHRTTTHNLAAGSVADLSIVCFERSDGDGIRVAFDANRDFYTPEELAAHQRRFLGFLDRFARADPELPVGQVEVMDESDRRQVLANWNDTGREIPPATLPELFQAQARRTPQATALLADGVELSYAELNRRANRLARRLIAAGLGPDPDRGARVAEIA